MKSGMVDVGSVAGEHTERRTAFSGVDADAAVVARSEEVGIVRREIGVVDGMRVPTIRYDALGVPCCPKT